MVDLVVADSRADDPAVGVNDSTGTRRAFRLGVIATAGFLVGAKTFAYIGIAALNLFIGELLVVAAIAYGPSRRALLEVVRWLVEPARLHLLTWIAVVFLGFGVLQLGRGISHGYDPLEALKHFAFNYYVVFLALGLWISHEREDFLERCVMATAWANAIYAPVFILFLNNLGIYIPGANVYITGGTAAAVSIVGLLCYDRNISRHWYLVAANVFALLAFQIRAEWLALLPMMLVWGVVRRRLRVVTAGIAIVCVALWALSYAHVALPSASGRGGEVSLSGIVGRAIAPFDEDRAAGLVDDADAFAGSAKWRTQWWTNIRSGVESTDTRWLFGYGYGFELRTLAPSVEEGVRTPHSVFFYALGYTGWVGVFTFGLFYGTLGFYVMRAMRRTGDPFGLCLWVGVLALSMFGNWFETPYGAIPTYVLLGASIAPLLRVPQSFPSTTASRAPEARWQT